MEFLLLLLIVLLLVCFCICYDELDKKIKKLTKQNKRIIFEIKK